MARSRASPRPKRPPDAGVIVLLMAIAVAITVTCAHATREAPTPSVPPRFRIPAGSCPPPPSNHDQALAPRDVSCDPPQSVTGRPTYTCKLLSCLTCFAWAREAPELYRRGTGRSPSALRNIADAAGLLVQLPSGLNLPQQASPRMGAAERLYVPGWTTPSLLSSAGPSPRDRYRPRSTACPAPSFSRPPRSTASAALFSNACSIRAPSRPLRLNFLSSRDRKTFRGTRSTRSVHAYRSLRRSATRSHCSWSMASGFSGEVFFLTSWNPRLSRRRDSRAVRRTRPRFRFAHSWDQLVSPHVNIRLRSAAATLPLPNTELSNSLPAPSPMGARGQCASALNGRPAYAPSCVCILGNRWTELVVVECCCGVRRV